MVDLMYCFVWFLIVSVLICYFTVDLPIDDAWSGNVKEQCVKMVDHTPLSEQQVAQLMRSLILVEQVRTHPFHLTDMLCFCLVFFSLQLLSVINFKFRLLLPLPRVWSQGPWPPI